MKILAVIGNESHSTSSGWSKLSVNGNRMTHREAVSKEWLNKYGDKHASWCECVFDVPEGAIIQWNAGANSGNRGMNRTRQDLVFIADSSAPKYETENIGYPASAAVLRGNLRLQSDVNADSDEAHRRLVESI